MAGILWFLFWQALGLYFVELTAKRRSRGARLWLGSVSGSLLAIWTPVPFAFLLGFTVPAHLFALGLGLILAGELYLLQRKKRLALTPGEHDCCAKVFLALFLPFMALWLVLLIPHTLKEVNGALYTGQCTYGDMSMHLGFITSIAEQGFFPPAYSILPGEKLCYPFLCDTVSSSMYLLGSSLRLAYIFPMIFAFGQLLGGVWFTARAFCRKCSSAVLAFLLFFLNGGLGMIYFVREHTIHELLTGFYVTPTNLIGSSIRWVNIIVDMVLPQRATLFGWAALFAALYLLFLGVFREEKQCFLPAGIIGGLLPMIHTHSFFALGLMALGWMAVTGLRSRFSWKWFKPWLFFGVPAVALAAPQLFIWTFASVSGNASFLRFNFDWVNGGTENWLWFWFKNVGPVFILTPLAFIFGTREKRTVLSGAVLIFVICELLVFQPNVYDDNKLLYIGYFFGCLLSAELVTEVLDRLRSPGGRALLLAVFLFIATNAAVMSLLREALSGFPKFGYELFSADEVRTAEYIRENCAPDSIFLTEDNHDNAVAVLTGRNIVCGSSAYLYFHGVAHADKQALCDRMLTDAAVFEANKEAEGIDYVYIGYYERALAGCIEDYFAANYPCVFSSGGIAVYDVHTA